MLSTSILYCNNIEQSNSRPSPPQSSSLQSDDLIQNHHYHHHHRRRYKHHNDDSSTKSNVNPQRYLRTSSNRTQTTTTNRSIDGQSSLSGGFSKNSIVSSSFSTNKTKINNSHRYRVQYLGCNSCDIRSHKPDNGIGAYQKPLLDLYSAIFRRSLVNRSLLTLNQVADLSTHGIFIAEKDRFTSSSSSTMSAHHDRIHSRPGSSASNLDCNTTSNQSGSSPSTIVTKVITPLSNILLWAAVRLQHRTHFRTNNSNRMNVKNTKRRQIGVAFVPLSCSEAVLDKNAFITLNSKQKFLLGIPHPPLFVCILQKINSNQRLECHLFVCGTTDDAIHMCNSMDELRQCQSTIGRLQIPAAGQMGKYSYNNNRHHRIPSSSTSSIITRSSTPSQTASEFSILSTTISRPRFSDIEEEDADVEEVVRENDFNDEDDHLCVVLHNGYIHQKETDVKKLIDNYQSQIVDNKNNSRQAMGNKTIQHSATTTTKNNDNNDGQSKIKYSNARLYDQTTRMIVDNKVAINNQNDTVVFNNNVWPSELSSIISGGGASSTSKSILSNNTKKLQHNDHDEQHAGLIAQRDYRFESYKPTSSSSSSSSVIIGDEPTVINDIRRSCNKSSKNVTKSTNHQQLHRPKSEHNLISHHQQHLNQKNQPLKKPNKWPTTNDLIGTTDELLKNRLFAKQASLTNQPYNNVIDTNGQSTFTHDHNEEPTGLQTFFGDSMRAKKNHYQQKQQNQKISPTEQTIISNSIFLGNEDDFSLSSRNSRSSKDSLAGPNQKTNVNHNNKRKSKKTNLDKLIIQTQMTTESPQENDRLSSSRLYEKDSDNNNRSLKLYLPTEQNSNSNNNGANLGVKGFNKSSRVETWSTMIAATASDVSACNLCQMELENCDKCCSFCQAIEQHKQKFRIECQCEKDDIGCENNINDDIILDDMTMENFHTNFNHNDNNCSTTIANNNKERLLRQPTEPINNNQRLPSQCRPPDPTFFSRIRRLSWQSLFGSSRKKANGSRLWNRLRTGSQRLRGSRRYFQNKSRIFLPQTPNLSNNTASSNDHRQKSNENCPKNYANRFFYDEHYLKPPIDQQHRLKQINNYHNHHENNHKTVKKDDNNSNVENSIRTDEKITETNDNDNKRNMLMFHAVENMKINNNSKTKSVIKHQQQQQRNKLNKTIDRNHSSAFVVIDNDDDENIKLHPSRHSELQMKSMVNFNKKIQQQQKQLLHDSADFISPFFISHPGKQSKIDTNNPNHHLEAKMAGLGLNGISISSDSGMEEYDCHSSAEHSPSGNYYRHQNSWLQSSNDAIMQKSDILRISNKNLHPFNCIDEMNNHSTLMENSKTSSLIMPYTRDFRRKAGHWSNTNLESQLDFIP